MKNFVFLCSFLLVTIFIFSCKEKTPEEIVADNYFKAINEGNSDIIHKIAYETFETQLRSMISIFGKNYGKVKEYELYNNLKQREDGDDFKYLFYKCTVEKFDKPVYNLLKLYKEENDDYKIIGSYFFKSKKVIDLIPEINEKSKKFIENYFDMFESENYSEIGQLLTDDMMYLKDTLIAMLKEQTVYYGKIKDYNFFGSNFIPVNDTLELYLFYQVKTDSDLFYYEGFLLKMQDNDLKLNDYAYGGTMQYLYDYFGF